MSGYIGPQPVVEATQNRESFTAAANQNSFATAGYQVGYLDIFLNGVKLAPADYTATNGSDVVLAANAAAGDILEVTSYSAFSLVSPDFTGNTTAVNLTVTGNLEFSSLSGTGSVAVTDILDEDNMASNSPTKLSTQQAIKAYVDSSSGAGLPLSGGTMTGDIAFGDADKAIFGAGSNLEVFHEGNSLIRTTSGSQNLVIKSQATGYDLFLDSARDVLIRGVGGENGIKVIGNGAVELYHNNVKKIETTATGIDVTGTVLATGVNITNVGTAGASGTNFIIQQTNSSGVVQIKNHDSTEDIEFGQDYFRIKQGGAERMRIDSSGRVLVAKTASGAGNVGAEMRTGVNDHAMVATTSGNASPLAVNRQTGGSGPLIQMYIANSHVANLSGDNTRLLVESAGDASGLRFDASGYTPFKNGTTANGTVDLGFSSGRFKDLYLSGGVYLGGTGSANKISDYETGSWTPTLVGGITNHSISQAYGHYTKVGDLVYIYGRIQLGGGGTAASGQVIISGLPFSANANAYVAGDFYINSAAGGGQNAKPLVFPSSSRIYMYEQSTTGVGGLSGITLGVSFDMLFNFTYKT